MSDTEPSHKRPRRLVDTSAVPSKDLAGAAQLLEIEREQNKRRAEKFGIPYVEPNLFRVVPVGEAKRLLTQKDSGFIIGFNPADEAERVKAEKRAAKYGTTPFSYDTAPAKTAGWSEEAIALRQARRERAKKFGGEDELDKLLAKAAVEALGTQPAVVPDEMGEPPEPRDNVLHVRSYGYIPASTQDLMNYFEDFRPAYIEWLNGISVNVIFGDENTAKLALLHYAEPIPQVAGIPPVDNAWRVCLKPLVKKVTDKYAPAGTETTLYVRPATTYDVKERAKGTTGARTHGTYSKGGAYSRRGGTLKIKGDVPDIETLLHKGAVDGESIAPLPAEVGVFTGAAQVATRVAEALMGTADALTKDVDARPAIVSGSKRKRGEVSRIVRVVSRKPAGDAAPEQTIESEIVETTVAVSEEKDEVRRRQSSGDADENIVPTAE